MNTYIEIIRKSGLSLRPLPTEMKSTGHLHAKVRAFLFDIYGTLFISGSGDVSESREQIETKRLGTLLADYGCKKKPDIVIKNYYNTIHASHARQKAGGVDYPEVQIESVWMYVLGIGIEEAREFAVRFEAAFNPVCPMPSVMELFSILRESGCAAGLISNAQFYTPLLFPALLGASTEELGLRRELCFYSYIEGHAKPSSYMFEKAGKTLRGTGVDPENVLYTGNDMLNDILPAKEAGFQTALFAGDSRSLRLRSEDERCRCIAPDIVVTDLMRLVEYINVQ
jgi:putative hydrolase of the HAD superfamily